MQTLWLRYGTKSVMLLTLVVEIDD